MTSETPDTPSTEALTPDEERALRVALEHGEAWPRTTAYSLLPVLLATLDAERAVRQEVADTIGHGPCDYNGGPGSDQCPHGVFAPQGDDDA
jgi:hypothetical protein